MMPEAGRPGASDAAARDGGRPAVGGAQRWALALFRRSVLKQRKYAEIAGMLGPTEGLDCLDLGSDNGVVSLLLRGRGGRWASADLTQEAVASIRGLVNTNVHLVDGAHLPFRDAEFDRVVVVDMLEHVADDALFVAELARVTKPGGRLVVNTPHLKRTLLRRVRSALGQTDEKHGHVRAGYTLESLRALLGDRFTLEGHRTYSRVFSELADTAIHWGLGRLGKQGSAKGMVVTGDDLRRHARMFKAYSVIYPVMGMLCSLDALIPWASGYMLIATARRVD